MNALFFVYIYFTYMQWKEVGCTVGNNKTDHAERAGMRLGVYPGWDGNSL